MNINSLELTEILAHVEDLQKNIWNIQEVVTDLRKQYDYTESLLSLKWGPHDKRFIRDALKTFKSIENIFRGINDTNS